jgi:ribosomal protein S18 acetylase RimI-like enzyme
VLEVRVRPFTESDRKFVVALSDATQREMRRIDADHFPPVRAGEAAEWFEGALRTAKRRGHVILVGEVNDEPVGYVIAGVANEPWTRSSAGRPAARNSGEILELHVLRRFRREGVATSLLAAAERALAHQGFGEVVLGHLAANAPATGLYAALDYRPKWVVRVKRLRPGRQTSRTRPHRR